MPVAGPLRAILDNTKRTALTILTAPNGKPWRTDPKPTHFQHHWRAATLAAGLDGLHFHDLRGTTCPLLAEAGATPSEIAAMRLDRFHRESHARHLSSHDRHLE